MIRGGGKTNAFHPRLIAIAIPGENTTGVPIMAARRQGGPNCGLQGSGFGLPPDDGCLTGNRFLFEYLFDSGKTNGI